MKSRWVRLAAVGAQLTMTFFLAATLSAGTGPNDRVYQAPPIQLGTAFGATMVGSCTASAGGRLWKWLARLVPARGTAHAAQPPQLPIDPASLAAATQAKERHEQAIMQIQGVVGIGVGISDVDPREAVVEVYVEKLTPVIRAAIPPQLDHTPVRIVETGKIRAR